MAVAGLSFDDADVDADADADASDAGALDLLLLLLFFLGIIVNFSNRSLVRLSC